MILSDGGGHGTLAADVLSGLGASLAETAAGTQARLRDLLGAAAAVGNPVDLAGAADRELPVFARALEMLLADPAVGAVLVAGLFGGYGIRFSPDLVPGELEAAEAMAAASRRAGKPVVVHTLYAAHESEPLQRLRHHGIPVVGSLETACRAVAASLEWPGRPVPPPGMAAVRGASPPAAAGAPAARQLLDAVAAEGRDTLLETEVRELVAAYGVPLVEGAFCADAAAAAAHAERTGGAFAVKLVSGRISHKARAGGVVLGVRGGAAAAEAYHGIVAAAAAHAAATGQEADVRGVLMTRMRPQPIRELLVGAHRDPAFGAVITVGAGGSAVEVMGDVASRLLPASPADLLDMLAQSGAGRALLAAPGFDPAPLVALVLALGRCFLDHPQLESLELNPVFAGLGGVEAVDARAFLLPHAPAAVAGPSLQPAAGEVVS
jgi:acetate---CoA ligase (ADP-forming)